MKTIQTLFIAVVIASVAGTTSVAQSLTTPMASPKASVRQTIGISDVKVVYHRPAVKDRDVWGGLIPYDEVWRAGANDNTVIWFDSDLMVEGKSIKAGEYGLHMIPGKTDWTIVFSNNSTSWGSFSYKEEEDALRVKVKVKPASHQESLQYSFENLSDEGATLVMHWEKLQVPINISVDTKEIVFANMQNELRHLAGYSWQGWNTISNYCLKNNIHMDEAAKYNLKSMKYQKNFTNLNTHAAILKKTGKTEEASKFEKEAIDIASNGELNLYGYQLANAGEFDKAIDAFKLNTERNPTDPNVWDSLGEGYSMSGDEKNAIKYFKKSLSMNPDDNVRMNSIKYLKKYGVDVSEYEKELSKR